MIALLGAKWQPTFNMWLLGCTKCKKLFQVESHLVDRNRVYCPRCRHSATGRGICNTWKLTGCTSQLR